MSRWLLACLLIWAGSAAADERINVCYNYGCAAEKPVRYTELQLAWARKTLMAARNPEQERQALANVVGRLYLWAGMQSPIYADRGGNTADDAVNGAMDCIDHSTTTTRLLTILERRGWLRYHRVIEVQHRNRFFIFDHYSAAIKEKLPSWLPREKIAYTEDMPEEIMPDRFVVDSWFVDNGKPAVILPLEHWKDGGGPEVGN